MAREWKWQLYVCHMFHIVNINVEYHIMSINEQISETYPEENTYL